MKKAKTVLNEIDITDLILGIIVEIITPRAINISCIKNIVIEIIINILTSNDLFVTKDAIITEDPIKIMFVIIIEASMANSFAVIAS